MNNFRTLIIAACATFAGAFGSSACAANFGSATVTPAAAAPAGTAPLASAGPAAPPPAAAGPHAADAFRIVKPDGATLIAQGSMGSNVLTGTPITLSDKDAFAVSGGKCAFNVKYDEISATATGATTNRLYSNDRLIAQNSGIALEPNVLKTIWTQPYLAAGVNNVRVVVNAESATPSTKWVKITVTGSCGAVSAPVPAGTPAQPPAVTPPVVRVEPPKVVVAPPVVRFAPGSPEWNNLNNMWGYSNYAVTQLKTANYARYTDLARLNAAVTQVINAKTVEQGQYNSLITSWNTFVTEPAFKTLMANVVRSGDRK